MPEDQTSSQEDKNEFLFTQLVIMFQGAALQHMGKIKDPVTGRIERDLDQARHTIDILGMLEEKTRGNLGPREKQLLDHALFELRMNFLDEMRKPQTESAAEEKEQAEAAPQ